MTDPTITCPNCAAEIKLTESLAAPLIAATRQDYEKRILAKDAEIARRDASLDERQQSLDVAKASLDQQVADKLECPQQRI